MGLLARLQEGGIVNRVTDLGRQRASDFIRVPRIPGVHLTHYTALTVATHFACVSVISKNLAQCPWEILLEKANGDYEYQRTHPAYRIFNQQPNPEMTAQAFKEQLMIVALLWGAGYSEIEFDLAGRARYLWPLEPERCLLDRDPETEDKILRVSNINRPETILPWDGVYSVTGPGVGLYPFDMVVMASRTLAQALAQEQFGLRFYQQGTAMGGILSTDLPVDETQLEKVRAKIEQRVGGVENAFKFLVTSGLKYTPFNQSQRDAQAAEIKALIIEDICRFYGVPPHKVQHLLRSTNNNIEHQGIEYTRDCLARWARFAEQEAVKLFGGGRLCMKIDLDELAEGDAKSIAETDSILVNNGLRKRNELRQKRGWNSVGPIGDVLTVQGAMTTLEAIINAPAPRQGEQPGQQPAAPTPVPERRRTAAAAIYSNVIKRILRRQLHRAEIASKAARSAQDFRARIDEDRPALYEYLANQLDEAMHVVHAIGMNGNSAAVRNEVLRQFEGHNDLLELAFLTGTLNSFCDVDLRADEIAAALIDAK